MNASDYGVILVGLFCCCVILLIGPSSINAKQTLACYNGTYYGEKVSETTYGTGVFRTTDGKEIEYNTSTCLIIKENNTHG